MSDIEALQDAYCATSDREYRRGHGQFFTPRWIARGMARWVLATRPQRILDPAFGLGMLSDECLRQGFQGQIIGYEIDPAVVQRWQTAGVSSEKVDLRPADFLASTPESIEAAIVNPPYNRFQRRDLPPALQLSLARVLGAVASGYTNQYALFLYLVISRLAQGGRAAFIVPSEFLATGYGVQVKRFLLQSRRLRHLVLFDPATRVFADAATTACVLLFEGQACNELGVWHLPGNVDSEVFASLCSDAACPPMARVTIPYSELDATKNWQGLGQSLADDSGFVRLDVFGAVKRGIATGANEFFVLRPSDARDWNLAPSELVPCIASASAVSGNVFTDAQLTILAAQDKPTHLFDGLTEPTASAARYVLHGVQSLYHERYLTRMRRPWYRLEGRDAAPLLLAVFGRGGFRVCRNRTMAVNLTAFHGFYPKDSYADWVDLVWYYFQTETARLGYLGQQRAYGDGLKKLEPGDWSKLLVPDWRRWDSVSLDRARALAADAIADCAAGAVVCAEPDLAEFEDLIAYNRNALPRQNPIVEGEQQLTLM